MGLRKPILPGLSRRVERVHFDPKPGDAGRRLLRGGLCAGDGQPLATRANITKRSGRPTNVSVQPFPLRSAAKTHPLPRVL